MRGEAGEDDRGSQAGDCGGEGENCGAELKECRSPAVRNDSRANACIVREDMLS